MCCRAQLQGQFLMSLETSEGLLEEMGSQALATGSYCPSAEISKNIDNVSLTDVSNVSHLLLFTVTFGGDGPNQFLNMFTMLLKCPKVMIL